MERFYKQGMDRKQTTFLPPSLDEYVANDHPVRAIDAYVEQLEIQRLGFTNSDILSQAGQPAYAPSCLLKLYLYGYINRIRSGRKLEAETYRNLEVMWLLQGLHPSYKTITDFRATNSQSLKEVHKEFIILCKKFDLFGRRLIAIDGSLFRGNASKGSISTRQRLTHQIKKIERMIEDWIEQLNQSDDREAGQAPEPLHDSDLSEKIQALKQLQAKRRDQLEKLNAQPDQQVSKTDPDARLLAKRQQKVAGYNVQIVTDAKHKLICADTVINQSDQHQLFPMAQAAKEQLGAEQLEVTADAGYYEAHQIKQCVDHGITPYVPVPEKSAHIRSRGQFHRGQFAYDAKQDGYHCPAGHLLTPQGRPFRKRGKTYLRYVSKRSLCARCPVRPKCLGQHSILRSLNRWEHETYLEAHKARMQMGQHYVQARKSLVEHPFGTIKTRCGYQQFLVRGLEKVTGEWSLMALCYNFSRVLNIFGVDQFRKLLCIV